ncbi:hypothetical protein [Pantoea sp. FN0305]|uniref:hypothetical protein n=1 Tax=Pantoea sp. FN0305 TaxID=3418559 RepID=UPI003CE797F0
MIRTEFSVYEDGFYFLYVTEEVRIETDGIDGLLIEDRYYNQSSILDPMKYLTIKNEPDEYFNESLINPHIDTLIEAVKVLIEMYDNEFIMNGLK